MSYFFIKKSIYWTSTNQLPSIKTPYVKRDELFKISYRDSEVDSIHRRAAGENRVIKDGLNRLKNVFSRHYIVKLSSKSNVNIFLLFLN